MSDLTDMARVLDLLVTALADTGHLRTHCRCTGDTTCVPCEVAASTHEALQPLGAWRARAVELIDELAYEARITSAVASRRESCAACMKLDRDACRAYAAAIAWQQTDRS